MKCRPDIKGGLSANRSMSHYRAWLWIEGEWSDEDIAALEDYEDYGKPKLIKICNYLGIDHSKLDDGVRTNAG